MDISGLNLQRIYIFTHTDVYKFLIWCSNHMRPDLIKQCPNCSTIVPETGYVTNLRTINLKINMLVYTFCTLLPAI